MDTKNGLSRHFKFALMSALAAGLISIIMRATFLEVFNWLFSPSVMIMVFISAFFAFRRQMRGKGALNGKRIYKIALEVGTISHFYTFALYFPLNFFVYDLSGLSSEMFMSYIASTFVVGIISIILFVWIAVPMYMGVGHILKSLEKDIPFDLKIGDESLLDDVIATAD